jgi:uncharacterized membrane protein YjgN (DUF898 family)
MEILCSTKQTKSRFESQTNLGGFMRNVAFSVMLFALAVVQVAVVTSELSHSKAQTAAVAGSEASAMQVLASTDSVHKTSSL